MQNHPVSLRIGIDGNEANVTNRVGSNIYAYELIKSLALITHNHQVTIYLKDPPLPDMPPETNQWQYRVIQPKKFWTQIRLPLDLQMHRPRPHVFFSPGHYAPRTAPMPTVISIMDLAFLHHPNLFLKFKRGTKQLTDWTAYSVKQAAHIIAISEYTKTDVCQSYQRSPQDITVAYPGINLSQFSPATPTVIDQVKKTYLTGNKFILYVGTLQPRKNLLRLIEAFESLQPRFKTYSLVLAGQPGWLYQELDRVIESSPKRHKIIRPGFIDRQDLPALYSAASATCLVGLHEGFGIPPAESLACGTIPIVADNTSLPEVVGEAGILVDPYSVTSIRHGIKTALEMSPERKQLRLKLAKKHLSHFDWHKSAKIVLKTLEKVALSA